MPAMSAFGLGLLPYFPLASGLLTGKYRRDEPLPKNSRFAAWPQLAKMHLNEANWQIVEALGQFCAARNFTMAELALSWLAAQPLVASVIAGATKPDQVEQNSKAVDRALSAEEMAEIDRITRRT